MRKLTAVMLEMVIERALCEVARTFGDRALIHGRRVVAIDDVTIFDGESKKEVGNAWLTSTVPATLTPGWHRLQIRTYAWGYGWAKAGIAIDAPLEKLWGLGCSGRPSAEK